MPETKGLPVPLLRGLLLFFVLTLACITSEILCRLWHWNYPYVWPLTAPYPPFVDFTAVVPRFAFFGTPRFFTSPGFPFTYPAPLAPVFALFAASPWPLSTFLLFVLLSFGFAGVLFARALGANDLRGTARAMLLLAYACSFPLWFELQQANCEGVVWVLTALGLWAFLTGRNSAAAALFGMAGAMKLYPFVFLGLFMAKRQYRIIVVGCAVALAVSLLSLWGETGSVLNSWHGTVQGLDKFRQGWVLAGENGGFDHSIFGLIKRSGGLGRATPSAVMTSILRWYTLGSAGAVLLLFVTRLQKLPRLNQIIALTVVAIVVPPTSFDYTLIHLYAPCALVILLLLQQRRAGGYQPGLQTALLLFGILLAPLTEFIHHRVSFAGELECVTLLLLLAVSLRYPWTQATTPLVPPMPQILGTPRAC